MINSSKRDRFLFLSFLFLLLLLTNRHYSFKESIERGQTDVRDYVFLAQHPPHEWTKIPFYHAQRFVIPYGLGLVSRRFGVGLEWAFLGTTVLCLIAILVILSSSLVKNGFSKNTYLLCSSFVVFNPYLFRFYLVYPAMVTDTIFILGLTLMITGLWNGKKGPIYLGAVLAALTRQTVLLLLPPLAFWLWKGTKWKSESSFKRVFFFLSAAALIAAIYSLTAAFLGDNFLGLRNFSVGRGKFLQWTREPSVVQALLDFSLRVVFPFLIPWLSVLGIFAKQRGFKEIPKEVFLCLGFSSSMLIQTLSAGLTLARGHIRFSLHAFIPLTIAAAILLETSRLKQAGLNKYVLVICLATFAGSFHHQTSILSPFALSNLQFGLWNLLCGGLAFIASYRAAEADKIVA